MTGDLHVVPSAPDYAVTEDGRVFRVTKYPFSRAVPFEMKQRKDKDGYLLVGTAALKVHRLVAEAFVPNPASLPQVRHKNAQRADNRAENLDWGTAQDNANDTVAHGHQQRGEEKSIAKLTAAMVEAARERAARGETHTALAEEFPVERSVLSRAIRGDTWRHV